MHRFLFGYIADAGLQVYQNIYIFVDY